MYKILKTTLLLINIILSNQKVIATYQHPYTIDKVWSVINTDSIVSTVMINLEQLNNSLLRAPKLSERIESKTYLKMPSMKGEMNTFRFYETSVMAPTLSGRYPNIKSYMGFGIENPSDRASIIINANTLMGMTISESGESFFKSFNLNGDNNILQISKESLEEIELNCNTKEMVSNSNRDATDFPDCMGTDDPCNPVGSELVTYRFAAILTEDVTNNQADSTLESGLTWLAAMINQANLLTIRDFSFKLQIVDNNDLIIFTDENLAPEEFKQDCGDDWSTIGCELEQVEPVLDSLIGPGGWDAEDGIRVWDYGALFDEGYPGGLAYCPGATSANLPVFYIFIHETVHNFGSPHNSVTENGIRSSIGGSIMHWSLFNTGAMFSTHSIEWAMNYRSTLGPYGNSHYIGGYDTEQTNNIIPDVVVPEGGFIIPKETPFELEGYSSPIYNEYAFNWESNESSDVQYWTDPNEPELPYFPNMQGSLFTPVNPTHYGYKRTFPDMNTLLDNEYETAVPSPYTGDMLTVEKLPFGSREMNMRLVVRTNDPYAGSLNHKNLQFFVAGTAGPFRVTSQEDSTVWEVGSEETVTWNVANTDDPDSVNCQAVDILLSIDGNENFDFSIAESIPNTGIYTFNVPPTIPTNSARLIVLAADNVFFDINNGVINIQNDNIPSIALSDEIIQLSLPNDSLAIVSVGITNIGEEGSVLSYQSYPGSDFQFNIGFDDGSLPEGWSSTTNAECENPGWFISEDASSSYFSIPPGNGYYIATNDDVCNSDGSNDKLYTGPIVLPDANISLSFLRYFTAGFSQSFHVLISSDNWESSTELLSLGYWEGNSEEWVQETINLNDYAGEGVEIAFHSNDNGNWASGVAVDDIRLGIIPLWINSDGSGYVNYMESSLINISVNANGMEPGIYESKVVVQSITTDERDTVGVQLTVEDATVGLDQISIPIVYHLAQNYPNPFNPITTLDYGLPEVSNVKLVIYDILGREVTTLVNGVQDAGHKSMIWHGTDAFGKNVGAGMYFYLIQAGEFRQVKKMVLLK